VKDMSIHSDVARLEITCVPSFTTCDEVLEEDQQGFDSGGEVMHFYSTIFQPSIHVIRVLQMPTFPDEINHQFMHCIKKSGRWRENCQYVHVAPTS
jgi:hypothetical protein